MNKWLILVSGFRSVSLFKLSQSDLLSNSSKKNFVKYFLSRINYKETMSEENFIDETGALGPFNLDDTIPEPQEVPEHSELKKPGRKKNDVWKYFEEADTRKGGHSPSVCKYCGDAYARGRVPDMIAHLALQCESVDASVKEYYLRELAAGNNRSEQSATNLTKKRKLNVEIATGIQPKITSKLQNSTIDPGQRNLCNQALTQFFVCCGIPFATVESPFFIDLIKNLCAGYKLPDRRTLSNDWLNNETARIKVNVEDILKKQENLSLGKFFNNYCFILYF